MFDEESVVDEHWSSIIFLLRYVPAPLDDISRY